MLKFIKVAFITTHSTLFKREYARTVCLDEGVLQRVNILTVVQKQDINMPESVVLSQLF